MTDDDPWAGLSWHYELQRDYSRVRWPWEGDKHWQQPREGATSNPADGANWLLCCEVCGAEFDDEGTLGDVIVPHWNTHVGVDPAAVLDKPRLLQVWRGLGTPPNPPKRARRK